MKAIILTKFGPPEVLKIQEINKSTPKDNEVLVKIKAVSVNYGDLLARNFKDLKMKDFNMPGLLFPIVKLTFGLRKPRIKVLGSEISGVVKSIGENVTKFKIGDEVFGYPGQSFGGYAEYICMKETGSIAHKPSSMTFEEAACLPYGAVVAMHVLEKVNINTGSKVLVIGASGGIGSAAVQLLKSVYKTEVTGVCSSPRLDYVRALGADSVIDYKKEDFTRNGEKYDLILDVLGRNSFFKVKNSLNKNGTYLLSSFKTGKVLQMIWTSIFPSNGKKVVCAMSGEKQGDFYKIKKLGEKGKIKSIVDKVFPMEEATEAHKYMEKKENKGKVAIKML